MLSGAKRRVFDVEEKKCLGHVKVIALIMDAILAMKSTASAATGWCNTTTG